ncbi:hypothetical protein Scel_44470 [Streptomyces cellostaticus]|nr:hypothetical protein Scel_44470 [Streptomyces cellostaticus]
MRGPDRVRNTARWAAGAKNRRYDLFWYRLRPSHCNKMMVVARTSRGHRWSRFPQVLQHLERPWPDTPRSAGADVSRPRGWRDARGPLGT